MFMQSRIKTAAAAVSMACAAGCGGGGNVEGAYQPQGDTFFDSLSLMSDGQAQVTMIGVTYNASYAVDGDEIAITAPNGTRTPFTFDGKCLKHPIAGTYCRSGSAAAASSTPAAAATASGGTEVYHATVAEGMIMLELKPGGSARMTMMANGGGDQNLSFDVSYQSTGDGVRVMIPFDEPIVFTRSGRDLVGTMDGEDARFVRQ